MSEFDENVNVQFKYSKSGTPYIECPGVRIAFSKATKTRKGFKFLVISHSSEQSFFHKGKRFTNTTNESYIKKVDFSTSGHGDKKISDYVMPKKVLSWFTKIFKSLIDGDCFPEANIEMLESIINDTDFNKLYADKKKRRKKRA